MVLLVRLTQKIEKEIGHIGEMHFKKVVFSITEGFGYLDGRDLDDKWICVSLCGGELLILSPRVFHRFIFFHDVSLQNLDKRARCSFLEGWGGIWGFSYGFKWT